MAYSDSTPNQSFWSVIKDTLTSASLVVTNPSTSATSSVSIKATYNDSDTKPIVVIRPPSIPETFDKFGGTVGRKNLNISIQCLTEFSKQCDELDDQIRAAIASDNLAGLALVSYESDYGVTVSNNTKFHSKMISISYLRE